MSNFGIAVREFQSATETLRVLRSYSSEPLATLRSKLGTPTLAIVFSMFAKSSELGNEASIRMQRRRLFEARTRLIESGARVELLYWVTSREEGEVVDMTRASNLIASDLEYLEQEHD